MISELAYPVGLKENGRSGQLPEAVGAVAGIVAFMNGRN